MSLTKKHIYGTVYSTMWESELKFANHLSEDECHEITEEISTQIVDLLNAQGESIESLFNIDDQEQPFCVVIDDLDNNQ